jgi:hypothetical protein
VSVVSGFNVTVYVPPGLSPIEIGDCMMLAGEACANSAAVNCGAGVSVTLKTGGRPAVKVATSEVGAGVKVWAGGGGGGAVIVNVYGSVTGEPATELLHAESEHTATVRFPV